MSPFARRSTAPSRRAPSRGSSNSALPARGGGSPAGSRFGEETKGFRSSAEGERVEALRAGVEGLTGLSMADMEVHFRSPRPEKIGALAYAEGSRIYVAPGQEGRLAHEAWHVAQQLQGRVRPTGRVGDKALNADPGLEREADRMGGRLKGAARGEAAAVPRAGFLRPLREAGAPGRSVVQRYKDPKGNLKEFDDADLDIHANNGGIYKAPTVARVVNSGKEGPDSQPPDPNQVGDLDQMGGAWIDLVAKVAGTPPAGSESGFKFTLNADKSNKNKATWGAYTRMHAVNSKLAQNSNVAENIFMGLADTNKRHTRMVETTAQGFVTENSWQTRAGDTLQNLLNNQDKIGKNNNNDYYYRPGGANTFPAKFLKAGTVPAANGTGGGPFQEIDQDDLPDANAVAYRVTVTYGLQNVAKDVENELAGAFAVGANKYNGAEDIPVGAGSEVATAADALTNLYPTRFVNELETYTLDLTTIAKNTEVNTEDLDWERSNRTRVRIDTPRPGIRYRKRYKDAANKWRTPFILGRDL